MCCARVGELELTVNQSPKAKRVRIPPAQQKIRCVRLVVNFWIVSPGSWVRFPHAPPNFLNPQSLSGQGSFSTLNLRLVTTADAECGGDKYGRLTVGRPPYRGADAGSSPVRSSKKKYHYWSCGVEGLSRRTENPQALVQLKSTPQKKSIKNYIAGWSSGQLAWLITTRSGVRIPLPLQVTQYITVVARVKNHREKHLSET